MGVPEGTVKARLSRARELLRSGLRSEAFRCGHLGYGKGGGSMTDERIDEILRTEEELS